MENLTCLAIDMGASNIRIMLGKISAVSLEFKEIHRFRNVIIEKEGHERWDIEYIIREIIEGIRKAVDPKECIGSIGVDAWGVDYALLDDAGDLLELPVAYRDKRTDGMEDRWLAMMSREDTFQRSGINFYIFNTLFQLLSLNGIPASKLLFLPSYVLYKLCGRGINELTISSTSQMLNARSGDWDAKILETLGTSSSLMGDVCAPGTRLGKICHPDLDMPDTVAIAVCGHDTASAVVSVPFENDSSVFISTGTWCLVGIESEGPILTGKALQEGFTNERGYGGTFRFLKNIVGLWLIQGLIKSLPVRDNYDEIESLAFGYDGPEHIINPGDPLFFNPENMRKAFDAYFRKTDQDIPDGPEGYFRSAYDSLIFSFRYHIEQIENMTGKEIDTIHLIGGGCHSAYLTRQTANICSRKVVAGPGEAAAIGNILVQSIAMGILPGLEEARKLVSQTVPISRFDPGKPDQESSYLKFLSLIRM